MNIKLAAATLGAALVLATSPASAGGMQPGPIHIYSFTGHGGITSNSNGDNVYTPGSAAIAFTNQYDFPATEVIFAIETHGYVVDRFDDVGSFATGVTINHSFGESRINSAMRVAVEKATFADGTVWVNPDVPQLPQPDTTVGVPVNDR